MEEVEELIRQEAELDARAWFLEQLDAPIALRDAWRTRQELATLRARRAGIERRIMARGACP